MAIYTGTLATFGAQSLAGLGAEIQFIPSGPGVGGTGLYTARTVKASPEGQYGAYSVELLNYENLRPLTHYTLRIVTLDSASGFSYWDFPDWKIFPRSGGGDLADMIAVGGTPLIWWADPNPPLSPTAGTYWLNTSTGLVSVWE